MLGVLVAVLIAAVFVFVSGIRSQQVGAIVFAVVILVIDVLLFAGFFVVNPNEGRLLQLFGKYVGTVRAAGLRWANPLYTKRRVSLRVRNFKKAGDQSSVAVSRSGAHQGEGSECRRPYRVFCCRHLVITRPCFARETMTCRRLCRPEPNAVNSTRQTVRMARDASRPTRDPQ